MKYRVRTGHCDIDAKLPIAKSKFWWNGGAVDGCWQSLLPSSRKDPVEWKNRQQPRVLGLTASYLNGRRLDCHVDSRDGAPLDHLAFPSCVHDPKGD